MANDTSTEAVDSAGAEPEDKRGFLETLLGNSVMQQESVKKLLSYPLGVRVGVGGALIAAFLFIPYLGAVGLWDPWETHYGEVAREMIQRNDYVHPFWENAWFFSKPVFTMWMQALGMQLTGSDIGSGPSHLGMYTEWGLRLPFALFSILAVGLLSFALGRTVSARAALATAFVLCTMPLYFLISRQAVTDTPVVSAMVCAMACAIVGLFDHENKHRGLFWYGFYVFCAMGTLAKGLLGFGIPGVILILYAVLAQVPWNEKSLESHARWFFRRAGMPIFIALSAGLLAWAVTYSVFGNKFYGLTPLAFVFFGTAAILLGRAADGPVNLMRDLGIGAGLAVAAGVISATQQTRNAAIAVAVPLVGGLLYFIASKVKDEPVVPAFWRKFYEMRFGTGVVLFFAIALPWYHRMFAFESVDDESKLFWFRFLVHDHFARLGSGVHTTTPGGNFTYFIEQGGYAIYPWVVLVPGAAAVIARLRFRSDENWRHVGVLAALWLLFPFALIGASATKFHHYVFPMLPPLAVLIGLFIDKLWREGLVRHGVTLALGLPLLLLVGKDLAGNPKNFTDLFVYNYDRPYPFFLVQNPIKFWSNRPLSTGDLAVMAFLGIGGYLAFEAFGSKRSIWLKTLALALCGIGGGALASLGSQNGIGPLLGLGLGLAVAAAFVAFEAVRPANESRALTAFLGIALGVLALGLIGAGAGLKAANEADPLWGTLAEPANIKMVMGFCFAVGGILATLLAVARAKVALFTVVAAGAAAWGLWFNWSHWVDLSHHWTQRDQFWEYYKGRKPDEPITSFLMNWRGETFYSRNTVKQIKDNNLLYQYAQQPGREWALVEHNRLGILRGAVGQDKNITLIKKDLNNKFVLVTIE